MLSRLYGAELCYTPMIHSALFSDPKQVKYTHEQFDLQADEEGHPALDRPLIVQFCSNHPQTLLKAATSSVVDGVDLNLGCPQGIAKKGKYGAFLMDHLDLISELIKNLDLNLEVPVTAKYRRFDDVEKTESYTQRLIEAGSQMISIHGRTREQKGQFTGLADWEMMRRAVECSHGRGIPILGNGNILIIGLDRVDEEFKDPTGLLGTIDSLLEFPNSTKVARQYLCICATLVTRTATSAIKGHLHKLFRAVFDTGRYDDLRTLLAQISWASTIDPSSGDNNLSKKKTDRAGYEAVLERFQDVVTQIKLRLEEDRRTGLLDEGQIDMSLKRREGETTPGLINELSSRTSSASAAAAEEKNTTKEQLSNRIDTDTAATHNHHQITPAGRTTLRKRTANGTIKILATILAILSITHHSYARVPFTDQRGYRDSRIADDGLVLAIGIPLILASTLLCSARLDLLGFTILNLYSLLLDISLSVLFSEKYYYRINNSVSLEYGMVGDGYQPKHDSLRMSIQRVHVPICNYLTTRLARNGFTLAESSIFSSTGVALMIEVIRLTSARLRYSAYLLKSSNKIAVTDIDRLGFLPKLFRFPSPAIAIQHVLVSGVFLMAFTLAPLLVLSRRLGQRPTKRTRSTSSHRSISSSSSSRKRSPSTSKQSPTRTIIQKPIWTSEPNQPDYYHRFSNPDSNHLSRQHENALKENLRKIIALSIYTSIIWIGCFLFNSFGNDHDHRDRSYQIRWLRIAMLVYWFVCLAIGIGGWTTYLVRKKRIGSATSDSRQLYHRSSPPRLSPSWRSSSSSRPSRSKSRSKSPLPSSHTTTTTLISSFNFIVNLIFRSPTSTTTTIKKSSTTTTTTTTAASATEINSRQINNHNNNLTLNYRCRPSDVISKLMVIIRRTLLGSPPPPAPSITHPTQELDTRDTLIKTDSSFSPRRSASPTTIHHPQNLPSISISNSSRPTSPTPLSTIPPPSSLPPSLVVGSSNHDLVRNQELNFKRKFFHLLVCALFLPTVPFDIEFSSISFSVAFVIFTFCEFARYFAFYPIGAGIHLFFNEFIDAKDSGPVILSHFYLLTACSTGIWLDGQSPPRSSPPFNVKQNTRRKTNDVHLQSLFGTTPTTTAHHQPVSPAYSGCAIEDLIGVIILGVGDTCASVIGKRFGKIKWNSGSSKTVEGSLAFVGSVIVISLFLRIIGLVQPFPMIKYFFAVILISL
ncbi:hypothetical protein PSTT_05166 [Puccinia striiformis]|uniref:tRNA-dihydrouridine(16/17) synthase [NAD(P)(+)] n=1 Tax=Puccinia striiformis TaxID=27350 RepID=A0A2S4VQ70_9BASI|nr:hypothetical protein PSTT_05166 [Puccinia striiformis]